MTLATTMALIPAVTEVGVETPWAAPGGGLVGLSVLDVLAARAVKLKVPERRWPSTEVTRQATSYARLASQPPMAAARWCRQ